MTALNGRRPGGRQSSNIDPSPAANDAPGPDDRASAEALAARDRTGWPPHPSERRDFYHRIRVFPPEVAAWRKRMLRAIAADAARFRFAAGIPEGEIQARFDDGITYLREVARILDVLYGTPDLGNKSDPTDELVYIILARHTRKCRVGGVFGTHLFFRSRWVSKTPPTLHLLFFRSQPQRGEI
jgi:hypothetical protein